MGEETLGDPGIIITLVVVCRCQLSYNHQCPHTTTQFLMLVEIGTKACTSVTRGQTWQGHASCLKKTQLIDSSKVATSLHQTAEQGDEEHSILLAERPLIFS